MTEKNKQKGPDPFLRSAAGLGTQLMVAIAGFAYLGHLADEKWNSKPFGLLIGIGFAFIYGAYEIWKVLRLLGGNKKEDKTENE